MEKQIIVICMLLIAALIGITTIGKPKYSAFRTNNITEEQDEEYFQAQFEDFQWKYEKVYNDASTEILRYSIFKENLKYIENHNKMDNTGLVLGMNQFGDLTNEEFREKYSTYKPQTSNRKENTIYQYTNRPKKVDWIGTYLSTQVYQQDACGSCWAQGSGQALEAAYAKQYGNIQQLSIQELVDCVYPDKDTCLEGGEHYDAFQWVIDNGICARKDYVRDYIQKQLPCEKEKCKPILTNIYSWVNVPKQDSQQLLNHLSIVPVAVAIDGTSNKYIYYKSGIIKELPYNGLTHLVIAVGYNEQEGYIRLKNSYDTTWGDKGYFKVAILDGPGALGVNLEPAYPIYK